MIGARAVLIADGTSDEPLAAHVAALARRHQVVLDVVVPDFARLEPAPGRTVRGRLERLLKFDDAFDVLIVHRDAEGQESSARVREITRACQTAGVTWPSIPIVPIRMTEAWLLLDEAAIRLVAGKPTGRHELTLPPLVRVESVPDPKAALQRALECASALRGRRLAEFKRDFPAHRRQLLQRVDRDGPVRRLRGWQALERDVEKAMQQLVALHSTGSREVTD